MTIWEASRYLLVSSGITMPLARRSLWVHGATPLQFDAARRLLQTIAEERLHVRLVVTAREHHTLRFLRSTFTDDQILPVPLGATPVLRRFFSRLQVRHILLLDGGRSLPGQVIRFAMARQIPMSAVNVGKAAALDGALLDAARQNPEAVRLCVFDHVVAKQLYAMGIPAASIAITGCLDLEEGRGSLQPDNSALRRLVHLGNDNLVAAADVPPEEELLILDAFAQARQSQPGLRLFLQPRAANRLARLSREIRLRGWEPNLKSPDGITMDRPWDILLAASPGDLVALLPLAAVVIVGGTHSSEASGAVAAAALSAGAHCLVGPHRKFLDVPWGYLEPSPLLHPVEIGELAPALAAAKNSPVRPIHGAGSPSGASRRTYAAISEALPESPPLPPLAQDWRVPTLRDRAGASRVWRSLAAGLMKGRIETWADLRERLGQPCSVLCLGNGPSCEDPRLTAMKHDCLMRVNWRWKVRGFLADPQIVFVGDPATLHKVRGPVIGLWNISLEYGMLLRHLVVHGLSPLKYFTMERISPIIRDQTWPARPTNGALMIAAGAALEPDRLIIAGIDLYLHPDGRYPGDLLGNNQYSRSHTRNTDLDIIRAALSLYRGEVLILSDILREALPHPVQVSNGEH